MFFHSTKPPYYGFMSLPRSTEKGIF